MLLKDIQNFDLNQIADSGQCFRWKKTAKDTYQVIHKNKVVTISRTAAGAVRLNCGEDEYLETWQGYFDLAEDYGRIVNSINPRDEYLVAAGAAAQGIRILRQDPWEAMASFIISQRNNIPRIKKTIERICEKWGEPIPYKGSVVYTFPRPEVLENVDPVELEDTGAYYRAEYLISAAKNHSGRADAWAAKDHQEAYNHLIQFHGIGPKVANCICLFGLHHLGAFPKDTWIAKIEETHYKGRFPYWEYPGTAGVMQQYMFYYERMRQGKI